MNEYQDDQLSHDTLIGEITAAMIAEADAAFPDDRLARQHARILQRVDQEGRPAKIIAFPAAPQAAPASPLLRATPTTRWVAAAAVIAFIVGLFAGHRLPHDFRRRAASQVAANARGTATGTTLRSTTPPVPSDDEFLGELETAARSRAAVLQHIDALTPRAWEVAATDLP